MLNGLLTADYKIDKVHVSWIWLDPLSKILLRRTDTPLQNLHNEYDISFCFEKRMALLISEVEEYLRDESGCLLDLLMNFLFIMCSIIH